MQVQQNTTKIVQKYPPKCIVMALIVLLHQFIFYNQDTALDT